MRAPHCICVLTAVFAAAPLWAQPVPDYGLEWRAIGDPGNSAARPEDWMHLDRPVGRVDYEYRLTRTEITNTQWIEFVDTFVTHNPATITDLSVIGRDVYYQRNEPGNYGWYTAPGAEHAAAEMGWLSAARYCNWLHNGKANTPEAFESGVYDMSSFRMLPNNTWVGNSTRSPDARFWLPDWNEHVKGMHWDPNRLGPGQGGYWLYPHSSDSPPIGGLPGTPGAQTSAGDYPNSPFFVPVGSYPEARSPWDLLDGSGGAWEYLGEWVDGVAATRGTAVGQNSLSFDRVDYVVGIGILNIPIAGIRLASPVPAPGSCVLVMLGIAAYHRVRVRRRAW